MADVAVAAPTAPLPVEPPRWPGIAGMWWIDQNGQTWDLLNDSQGVVAFPGVDGLWAPKADFGWFEPDTIDGARYTGHRFKARETFWPLFVFSDQNSGHWQEINRRFWQGCRVGASGWWVVDDVHAERRWLRVRIVEDTTEASEFDPSKRGWQVYGVKGIAEQPFWQGPEIVNTWGQVETGVDFHTNAPDFIIGQGLTSAQASITNPGDVPAWPVWTITGPWSGLSVGYGGRNVAWSGSLTAGQTLVIDSRPGPYGKSVWLNGVLSNSLLTATNFTAIPPGEDRVLSVLGSGAGKVSCAITPFYERAF